MIVISKTLLTGIAGFTFAGILALASNDGSGSAVQPGSGQGDSVALDRGGLTEALPESSGAWRGSAADPQSDQTIWTNYRYQNHPLCPSNACSMSALSMAR